VFENTKRESGRVSKAQPGQKQDLGCFRKNRRHGSLKNLSIKLHGVKEHYRERYVPDF